MAVNGTQLLAAIVRDAGGKEIVGATVSWSTQRRVGRDVTLNGTP